MSLEQELLDATKVKKGKFKDRQKLLAAIVKVVEKLPAEEYDKVSDEAVDWYEKAVKAMNGGDEIPDFTEAEEAEAEEADGESEVEAEGQGDSEEAAEEAGDQERDAGETASETDADDSADEQREESAEPDEKPKKAAKKAAKPKKGKEKPAPTRYDNLSGKKDRYGLYEGTIVSDVAAFLEKGGTMAEVKAKFKDTKYNLIARLVKEGHHVEKEGPKFTLIHKDDYGAKAKGKKK